MTKRSVWPRRGDPAPASAVDRVFEAKLRHPPVRSSWVHRERLLDALTEATRRPVTLVAAPAGYGKTTLLAQWLASAAPAATAWLSLDSDDNDPDRLWTHVSAALARAGCPLPSRDSWDGGSAEPGPAFARALLPAMSNALAAHPDDVVLVLDDFHCVREQRCHEQVQHLVANLPPQAHLVLATRSDPGLRLGRLRVSGDLTEFRAGALSFTAAETRELLASSGVHLAEEALGTLVERTEGWPAGLYLAALSLSGLTEPEEFVTRFGGGDRFIGDYLIEEVLSRQDERVRKFITSAAFLDQFSAQLCDHVAGTDDAATVLRDLERSNLFVVPLDEAHEWFRFHHLFAAVARSEQELEDPESVRTWHARAAEWFTAHGQVDRAVSHLLAAGQRDEAAHLALAHWIDYVDAGRFATVMGWLEALGDEGVESSTYARVTAAWMAALAGDTQGVRRHLTALAARAEQAEQAEQTGQVEQAVSGPLPDGTRSVRSAMLLISAGSVQDGPLQALDDARRALGIEHDESTPQHAMAQLALGQALYLLGDIPGALGPLRSAAANRAAPCVVQVQSLSLQSLAEAERGDPVVAAQLAELALGTTEAQGLRATPQASLAVTAFGLTQAAAGKVEDALLTLEEDIDPRHRAWARGSWPLTLHLLATARVAAMAGRTARSRELVDEVLERLDHVTAGTEAMRLRVAEVQEMLRTATAADVVGEPLTRRELDVLRLLQSDLTPQEIADQLYLTANTVKTHVGAVYRKLGVHSRSEAVVVARRRSLV